MLSLAARSTNSWSSSLSARCRFDPLTFASRRRFRSSLIIGDQVKEALANGSPVVALESTVITHGLPEPHNLELAHNLERVVASTTTANRAERVTPATVGIIKGQLVVGLSADQIEYLAKRELSQPIKASRRDLPIAMAMGLSAGTTVAGTMAIVCSMQRRGAGGGNGPPPIKVFATGGTGGVHQGGELSMDISADLYEFARSPLGVVSSGFKSFLDTRRSLEFLETMGCTVMSLNDFTTTSDGSRMMPNDDVSRCFYVQGNLDRYNNNNNNNSSNGDHNSSAKVLFPGFFSRTNKEQVASPWPLRGGIDEAAKILYFNLEGPVANGRALLLAVPIPVTASESLGGTAVDLDKALASVSEQIDKRTDLVGKDKTPLMLERLNRVTGGKTLRANIELLKNNANVGAQLALRYAHFANKTGAVLPAPSNGDFREEHQCKSAATATSDLVGQGDKDRDSDADVGGRKNRACASPVVIGCTMIDMHVSTKIDDHFKNNPPRSGVTFAGRPHLTLGGVGRNLAAALHLLGHAPTFVTALGRDKLGSFARAELERLMRPNQLQVCSPADELSSSSSSSCFALVLVDSNDGQCEYVIANLEAVKAIGRADIESQTIGAAIKRSPLLVMDANLSADTIEFLIEFCHQHRVPIFIEPTDVMALPRLAKSLAKLQQRRLLAQLVCLSPNLVELQHLLRHLRGESALVGAKNTDEPLNLDQVERLARELLHEHLTQLGCLLVTMDKRGVLVAARRSAAHNALPIERLKLMDSSPAETELEKTVHVRYFEPPQRIERPVSASGAGDTFAAGFISGMLRGHELDRCLARGFRAAALTLQDRDTISPHLKSLA